MRVNTKIQVGQNPDKRRVWWKEEDCERMVHSEFAAMRCLLGAIRYLRCAQKDLNRRLESIPYGKRRAALAYGAVVAIANDLIGTMTRAQCSQLQNTMDDMVISMVPKLSPNSTNTIFPNETAKMLVNSAREKCRMCIADGEEARKCELYKVLEAITPLDTYGDGLTCPYYRSEFED